VVLADAEDVEADLLGEFGLPSTSRSRSRALTERPLGPARSSAKV
jgi:hypothetical protein